METTGDLSDRIVHNLSSMKEEGLDMCDMSRISDLVEEPIGDSPCNRPKDDLLPVLADDLISLCDSYNLYLINEEIVYTEPLTYESSVDVDSAIPDENIFPEEFDMSKEEIGNGKHKIMYSFFLMILVN